MTESSKPRRRAAPKRAARRPKPWARLRTPPGRVTAGLVVLVVVAVVVGVGIKLLHGDDGSEGGATGPGTVNASYANRWTAADGSTYEISVQTLTDLVAVGSADACIAAPPAGMTNLHFNVVVTNTSKKKAAPVPRVLFGTNVRPSGVLVDSAPSFAKSNKAVQITPLAKAQNCADGAVLGPDNRAEIPPGQSATFTGTFGPVKQPIVGGITVIARYFERDESATSGERPSDFLAAFGSFPATARP